MTRPSAALALLAALTVLAAVATACADETPPTPTTTSGTALPPRTTLPPVVTTAPTASTTTTTPPEVATAVDACALLQPAEVQVVIGEDPGPGTPLTDGDDAQPDAGGEAEGPPTLLVASCAWPTDGAPRLTLSILAPTTAGSGQEHLQRMVDLESRFARGARVFPVPDTGDPAPAALVDESGAVIEVAVVNGSALLYVVPHQPPSSGTPEAEALVGLVLAAAGRAPA